MSKRSITKTFNDKDTPAEIFDWMLAHLPLIVPVAPDESEYLKDSVAITINFDPRKKGSLIAQGPKEYHKSNGSEKGK